MASYPTRIEGTIPEEKNMKKVVHDYILIGAGMVALGSFLLTLYPGTTGGIWACCSGILMIVGSGVGVLAKRDFGID